VKNRDIDTMTIDEIFDELCARCVYAGVAGQGVCVLLMQRDAKNDDKIDEYEYITSGSLGEVADLIALANRKAVEDLILDREEPKASEGGDG